MYFRTHNSDFWKFHPISIVLRNRDLLGVYGIRNKQQEKKREEEEEQNDEEEQITDDVQLLYVHHLIATCQFSHIQIVGNRYSLFIHDLLRLLYVKSPEALQQIKSLEIVCDKVSLLDDLLPIVLSECHTLKHLNICFTVDSKVKSQLNSDTLGEYNDKISSCIKRNIPLKHLTVVASRAEYRRSEIRKFILEILEYSNGLTRLNTQNIEVTAELLTKLGDRFGHCLKRLRIGDDQTTYI